MSTTVNETARLAALAELDMMGSEPEERFDRIARMARDLFGVPIAEVHFLDDTTLFTKTPTIPGFPTSSPRAGTFCEATLERNDLLVIPDLGADEAWASHENVAGSPHIRFYAGRPLQYGDDALPVGTICLLDVEPRELTVEQEILLDEFGRWVERELRDTVDRDRAAEVQGKLAQSAAVHPAGYELAGLSIPRLTVAGDFYSWTATADTIDLTLVDVMGKGTAAAILAAGIRSAFRARPGGSPAEVVSAVNAQLGEDFAATETFATLMHARLDTATGRVEFVDAGHGLSVLMRADGGFQRLAALGFPVGIAEDGGWAVQTVELQPGDTLISFTDGLLDLYDGTLQSLTAAIELARSAGSIPAFFEAVRALSTNGLAQDDITVLAVRRL